MSQYLGYLISHDCTDPPCQVYKPQANDEKILYQENLLGSFPTEQEAYIFIDGLTQDLQICDLAELKAQFHARGEDMLNKLTWREAVEHRGRIAVELHRRNLNPHEVL